MANDYRARIYEFYVDARQEALAPSDLAGLGSRGQLLRQIIERDFPADRDAVILDLGCGHGAFVHFIRQAGYRNVAGVDASPQQVAAAARLGIEGVRGGDLVETLQSLPDHSHDVIVSFDVLEHFTKQEMMGFVDQVYRVLRNGGKWIVHAPNGESPFVGRILFGDFTHETAFSRESITQLLRSSGFCDVMCHEDAPLPHGLKSTIRWVLWKGIRAVLRLYLAVETGAGGANCIFSQNFVAVAIK